MGVFSFSTTKPNGVVAQVNHERRPVMLDNAADWMTWIDGLPKAAQELLATHPASRLRLGQAGFDKMDFLT